MKKKMAFISILCLLFLTTTTVIAADLKDLDRVSVLMPKSQVLSILGKPGKMVEMDKSLQVDLYDLENMDPLVVAGYIYGNENSLGGHALILRGNVANPAAERLRTHGFTLLEQTGKGEGASWRLAGRDDDTGQPVVVTIVQDNGLTIVMTFEKEFYDRHQK